MKIKYVLPRCELCKFIEDNFKIESKHEIDSIVFKYGRATVLVDEMEIICVEKESCDIETVKGGGVPRVDAFPDRMKKRTIV